ncbi:cytochrome c family protein [Cereibacter sphaeroides]|uniref:c-type cytochrome n=1 Tax=Cereibacter sphaeroides TaxID=1063 RepID=UPI001F39EE90|nr:cytochrome c family protein [Cereibacter sphaeroides]MCE6953328.1 cytochrome c family protein [Cereibacter sphaeroides]
MRLMTFLTGAAMVAAPAAFAEGDPAAGEKSFRKCMVCHQIGPEAENKTGPVLTGVVGRPAGSVDGFAYSKAMTEAAAGGLVWTEESLAGFLENPRKAMPGTKMSFPGIRKPEEIADLIAYLGTFSPAAGGDAATPAAGG